MSIFYQTKVLAFIVRSNGKWIHCNNQVSRECWPKGAKNLYLAFYEQTPLRGTKQHKFDPETLHAKFTPLNTTAKGVHGARILKWPS